MLKKRRPHRPPHGEQGREEHKKIPATERAIPPKLAEMGRVKLLFSIVNRGDEVPLKEILDDASVSLSFVFAGTGTARSALLDYLGIGGAEKAVVLSLIPEGDEEMLMRRIRGEMALYLVGRGISFTVPLSGISSIVAGGISKAASNKNFDTEHAMSSADRKYNLIVAAVAAGYVETAMEAAQGAGAAGGTIIRARTVKNEKAEQFMGFSLASEQEILLILTKTEITRAVMDALSERVGAKTEAGGVIYSMPVDRTAGISVSEEEPKAQAE